MTKTARVISFFPAFQLLMIIGSFYLLINQSFLGGLLAVTFCIYFLPILCLYFHNYFFPYKEGKFLLNTKHYTFWWGIHQFQLLFISLPFLEGILRLCPGLYSFWLRLWGSKIGKNVYWTPSIEILDRTSLEIGSNVIIGHKVIFLPHVIMKTKSERGLILVLKKIKIENNCFIGAGSRFGPGSIIKENSIVPVITDLKINEVFGE